MAGYRGHLAGAAGFYGVYLGGLALAASAAVVRFELSGFEIVGYPVALLGLCLMFALWPDVDTNSKGQNLFYRLFFAADVVLLAMREVEMAAYLGLFCILPVIGRHRGWTHTYWAMLLVPAPLAVLPYVLAPEPSLAGLPFYGAAVVGYFSHLVLDGLVVPLPGRRRRKTGWR